MPPLGQDDTTQTESKSDNPKDARLTQINEWWRIAADAQQEWERQAREDLDFYMGRQWDSADLEKLKREERPALTFNYLLSMVNLVSGIQRQNRQDLKAHPLKGGTRQVAEILTSIFKHVETVSMGDWHEAMSFVLGCICGKGFLEATIDYDEDPASGDLLIEYRSPFRVKYDPYHERYDLSDADYLFTDAWMPKERLERQFPEVKGALGDLQLSDDDTMKVGSETRSYKEAAQQQPLPRQDIHRHRYRVKRCWWKEYELQRFLVNSESGDVTRLQLSEVQAKRIIERRPNLSLIKRTRPILNLTTTVGNLELSHVRDPYKGMTRFPVVPFFAYWLEGECFGLITQAKDPQREVNKRQSQALHHLNQSANSGWIMDEGAVTDKENLENFGGKPGLIVEKRTGKFLQRIQPSALSEGHMALAAQGYDTIKRITGVNADLLGVPAERQESGIAMLRRQQQGNTVLESVHDNFRFTKLALGKVLIDLIQRSGVYTQEEVLNLMVDGKPVEVPINMRQPDQLTGQVSRVLNDLSVGKYGVAIDMQTQTPTTRWAHFLQLIDAVKSGLQIPPKVIIEASDLPNKDEIIAEMGMLAPDPAAAPPNGAPRSRTGPSAGLSPAAVAAGAGV